MNKAKLLSKDAVRRASGVAKLTAVDEKSLAAASGGGPTIAGSGDVSVVKGPVQQGCPHVEYPASAA